MAIENLAETILEKVKLITQADTVIGKPIQAGDTTIIPVNRISVGFGVGGHTGKGEIAASGGGASVDPVAFLSVHNGEVRILPVTKDSSVVAKVMDLVPDVVAKFQKKSED